MSSKTEALMHDWGDLALREASASSAAMAEAVDARDAEDRENIFPRDGFSEVICIPSPNLTPEERELWRRVRARTILRLPAESPGELLIRETRRVLCLMGYGKKVTIPALFAGINLALAKTMGVRIRTPLRGLPKR